MMTRHKKQNKGARFGGPWTMEKLNILEKYLDAYTTALKNQSFNLVYIDAFAGSGKIALSKEVNNPDDMSGFASGSAELAVKIDDKPFDKMIFVDKESSQCEELNKLREMHPRREIEIVNEDANTYLSSLEDKNWRKCRGVLFLDPFATEVEWATIKKIAGFNALDTWILFPVSAIARMLPKSRRPEDINQTWSDRLTSVFGDRKWQELYREKAQQDLFGSDEYERDPGVAGLVTIYTDKLSSLFSNRFLKKSRTLKNSKNVPLFKFLFCVGSPNQKAIDTAKRIAGHILNDL